MMIVFPHIHSINHKKHCHLTHFLSIFCCCTVFEAVYHNNMSVSQAVRHQTLHFAFVCHCTFSHFRTLNNVFIILINNLFPTVFIALNNQNVRFLLTECKMRLRLLTCSYILTGFLI